MPPLPQCHRLHSLPEAAAGSGQTPLACFAPYSRPCGALYLEDLCLAAYSAPVTLNACMPPQKSAYSVCRPRGDLAAIRNPSHDGTITHTWLVKRNDHHIATNSANGTLHISGSFSRPARPSDGGSQLRTQQRVSLAGGPLWLGNLHGAPMTNIQCGRPASGSSRRPARLLAAVLLAHSWGSVVAQGGAAPANVTASNSTAAEQ